MVASSAETSFLPPPWRVAGKHMSCEIVSASQRRSLPAPLWHEADAGDGHEEWRWVTAPRCRLQETTAIVAMAAETTVPRRVRCSSGLYATGDSGLLWVDTSAGSPLAIVRHPGWPCPVLIPGNLLAAPRLSPSAELYWARDTGDTCPMHDSAGAACSTQRVRSILRTLSEPFCSTDPDDVTVSVDMGVWETTEESLCDKVPRGGVPVSGGDNLLASVLNLLARPTQGPAPSNTCTVLLDVGNGPPIARTCALGTGPAGKRTLTELVAAVRRQGWMPPSWQLRHGPRWCKGMSHAACSTGAAFKTTWDKYGRCTLRDIDMRRDLKRPSTLSWFGTHAPGLLKQCKHAAQPTGPPVILLHASPWRPREVNCGRLDSGRGAGALCLATMLGIACGVSSGDLRGEAVASALCPLDRDGSLAVVMLCSQGAQQLSVQHLACQPRMELDPGPIPCSAWCADRVAGTRWVNRWIHGDPPTDFSVTAVKM